ncbi:MULTISPECIES: EcsC family protein [Bacillaceae]|uniref:EcsC family protein n=1 Tax=Evansella alkalicola TaxID=745819 RepID=A0ABS6JQ76_9BACI|nr:MULTISPECIES: EcsC family protein [Bacillaceae]MBU9720716.1 EcsC family protein [Bacillus alkalicola]
MTDYGEKIQRELLRWERKSLQRGSISGRFAKNWQNKINNKVPERFHQTVAESVKYMMKATLTGSDYLSDQEILKDLSIEEREKVLEKRIEMYKRTAALEGAGTGAGGIFLGLADFPLLLSIKMKFLFDAAKIYGYDVKDYRERLFLLSIFQLAFSKEEKKREVFNKITSWEKERESLPKEESSYLESIDWKTFQLEYRDFIDLPKTLQLIPGFGAIVGAVANYNYLDILSYHAKNSFRHRLVEQRSL